MPLKCAGRCWGFVVRVANIHDTLPRPSSTDDGCAAFLSRQGRAGGDLDSECAKNGG